MKEKFDDSLHFSVNLWFLAIPLESSNFSFINLIVSTRKCDGQSAFNKMFKEKKQEKTRVLRI
jgi:hypothetical protein